LIFQLVSIVIGRYTSREIRFKISYTHVSIIQVLYTSILMCSVYMWSIYYIDRYIKNTGSLFFSFFFPIPNEDVNILLLLYGNLFTEKQRILALFYFCFYKMSSSQCSGIYLQLVSVNHIRMIRIMRTRACSSNSYAIDLKKKKCFF